jgi:hypothetical protein
MNPFADSPAKLGSSNPFYETTDRTSDDTDEEVPLKTDSEHNPINENSLNEETQHALADELMIPTASTTPAEFTRIKSSRNAHEITPNTSRGDKLVAALAKKRESKRQMNETAAVTAYAEPANITTDIIEVERGDSSTKHNSYVGLNSALTSNKLRGGEDNSDNKGQIDSGVNLIYHKNRMSEPWLYTTLLIHIAQFTILLVLGHSALPSAAIIVLVLLVVAVAILLLYSRKLVKKNRKRTSTTLFRKKIEGKTERTPDEETDLIPSGAIYCLCAAAVLEGCTFALYTVMMAGHDGLLDAESNQTYGTSSRQIILETMRFASITLLAFHRILRPANRVDPMRTMLEVHPRPAQCL